MVKIRHWETLSFRKEWHGGMGRLVASWTQPSRSHPHAQVGSIAMDASPAMLQSPAPLPNVQSRRVSLEPSRRRAPGCRLGLNRSGLATAPKGALAAQATPVAGSRPGGPARSALPGGTLACLRSLQAVPSSPPNASSRSTSPETRGACALTLASRPMWSRIHPPVTSLARYALHTADVAATKRRSTPNRQAPTP